MHWKQAVRLYGERSGKRWLARLAHLRPASRAAGSAHVPALPCSRQTAAHTGCGMPAAAAARAATGVLQLGVTQGPRQHVCMRMASSSSSSRYLDQQQTLSARTPE